MSSVFLPYEEEACCYDCVSEWLSRQIWSWNPFYWFWNPEPKSHRVRFLAVVGDAYVCERHYPGRMAARLLSK